MNSVSTYALFVQSLEAFLSLPRERIQHELELAQQRRREHRCGTSLCLYASGFAIDASLPAGLSAHSARMIAIPFPDTDDAEALVSQLIQQVSHCLGDHLALVWRSAAREEQPPEAVHRAGNGASSQGGEQESSSMYLPTALLDRVYATWPHYTYRLTIRAQQITRHEEVSPLDRVSEAFRIYSLNPQASGDPRDYRCIGLRGAQFYVPRRSFEQAFSATDAPGSANGYGLYTNRATHSVQAVQIPFPFLVQGTMGRKDQPGRAGDFLFRTWYKTWDVLDEETFSYIYRYNVADIADGEGDRSVQ